MEQIYPKIAFFGHFIIMVFIHESFAIYGLNFCE